MEFFSYVGAFVRDDAYRPSATYGSLGMLSVAELFESYSLDVTLTMEAELVCEPLSSEAWLLRSGSQFLAQSQDWCSHLGWGPLM